MGKESTGRTVPKSHIRLNNSCRCIYNHKPKWGLNVIFKCPDCGKEYKAVNNTLVNQKGWIWPSKV